MTNKFLTFILIIYGFLFFGYGLKLCLKKLADLSRPISKYLMIFISPVIALNSLWSLNFSSTKYWFAPILYIIIMLFSLIPSNIYSRIRGLNQFDKGSIVASSLFSNTGVTLGGFICYLLYGEKGLYFSSLYISSFLPFYYLVAFPMMNHYSSTSRFSIRQSIFKLFTDPTSGVPITFIVAGITLNLTGIQRPPMLNYIVTHIFIYISTIGYSFSIGLGTRIGESLKYIRHTFFVALVKFIYTPIVALILLHLFGYFRLNSIIPSRVIMIESFMPAAIMSVVIVKIFDLNEDLANASWLITNMMAIAVFPILILVLKYI